MPVQIAVRLYNQPLQLPSATFEEVITVRRISVQTAKRAVARF
jgi:hypothetical protein